MNKATKILLKVLFLAIFLINPNNLFAEETDNAFFYLGAGPSLYKFNNNFKRFLGVEEYKLGFYMEIGFGLRRQGNRVHIGSEHTINIDWSKPGSPREKLRDDYRGLLVIDINYRYAFTFGKGNLIDPLFLPFAGLSIGWHRVSSRIIHGYGDKYDSNTTFGFGLFGGLEVKVYKCHKINIIFDYKPLYFKTFQEPLYKMDQYGMLIAYKVFLGDIIDR